MTALRLDPIDDDNREPPPVSRTDHTSNAVAGRAAIRWGDVGAVALVLAASVLFIVVFALVPILGAPD